MESSSDDGDTSDISLSDVFTFKKSEKGHAPLFFLMLIAMYLYIDVAASTPKRKRMYEINTLQCKHYCHTFFRVN